MLEQFAWVLDLHVEDGHNSVDDSLENSSNTIDDGHEAAPDGLEDALNL